MSHRIRKRFPLPQTPPQRPTRFKRSLVVLTFRDNRLDCIYSSTSIVQLIRLDLPPTSLTSVIFSGGQATQITTLRLVDLDPPQRVAVLRAFPRSSKYRRH